MDSRTFSGSPHRWPTMPRHLAYAYCLLSFTTVGLAQESPAPLDTPLPAYARIIPFGQLDGIAPHGGPVNNGLPHIVVTGYWPPTNEMLRQFSQNPVQNPDGWVGENWEQRGYNIYAFFPEFPGGILGRGEGDFEVDYQDTSNDWWSIIPQYSPIALITFSRAGNDLDWEIEGGNRMYALAAWINDYLTPFDPTPELPIAAELPGTERFSTQPMQAIVDAVLQSGINVFPYIEPIDNSAFLSNYIGYHGNWYRSMHASRSDTAWCIAAGHIHVGSAMSLASAVAATEVTIRTLIAHVDTERALGDLNCDGALNHMDISAFALALVDETAYAANFPDCDALRADANGDALLDGGDVSSFISLLLTP